MKRSAFTRLAAVAVLVALLPTGRAGLALGQISQDQSWGPVRVDAGTIIGTVWNRNDTPVATPRLRLRDATTGRIVQTTQGDSLGRFTFLRVPAGSYLVELVDQSGNVLALGQMFALGPLETVATFLRLGASVPWYTGFFSNAAAAALASAAALGLTAVGNGGQPASGRS
jgi:hypothetical protein